MIQSQIENVEDRQTEQTTMGQGGDDDEEGAAENMLNPTKKISKSDFQLVKVIGRGSFGKVYLVKKKDNPQVPLALKVLNKDIVSKRNLMIKTQGKYFIIVYLCVCANS